MGGSEEAHRDGHQILIQPAGPSQEPSEDIIIGEISEELRQERAEVLCQVPPGAWFPVRLLGGARAALNRGAPFDAIKSECANTDIGAFCVAYSLPRSAHFDISLMARPAHLCSRTPGRRR